MSSWSGAQKQSHSQDGTASRARTESGFAPARSEMDSLPPLERARLTWLVNVGGIETLEMTGAEITEAWREGRLDEETLVWRQGLLEWTAVASVPQLSMVLDRVRPIHNTAPEAAVDHADGRPATVDDEPASAPLPACTLPADPEPSSARRAATLASADSLITPELAQAWAALADASASGSEAASSASTSDEGDRESVPEDEVTDLRQALSSSLEGTSPVADFVVSTPEQLPEDEVTEAWGSRQPESAGADPASPSPEARSLGMASEAEALPEDEVTELWGSRSVIAASVDSPPPPFEPTESELERLPEDEVTELWGSRAPDPAAPQAPTLSSEEIEYSDAHLPEDEVTTHWLDQSRSGVAGTSYPGLLGLQTANERQSPPRLPIGMPSTIINTATGVAPRIHTALPPRRTPPPLPPRLVSTLASNRLTQPSMARLAEMRVFPENPVQRAQRGLRSAVRTVFAFWSEGIKGLRELIGAWLRLAAEKRASAAQARRSRGAWLPSRSGFRAALNTARAALNTAHAALNTARISFYRLQVWTSRSVTSCRAKLAERRAAWMSARRR